MGRRECNVMMTTPFGPADGMIGEGRGGTALHFCADRLAQLTVLRAFSELVLRSGEAALLCKCLANWRVVNGDCGCDIRMQELSHQTSQATYPLPMCTDCLRMALEECLRGAEGPLVG